MQYTLLSQWHVFKFLYKYLIISTTFLMVYTLKLSGKYILIIHHSLGRVSTECSALFNINILLNVPAYKQYILVKSIPLLLFSVSKIILALHSMT